MFIVTLVFENFGENINKIYLLLINEEDRQFY